MIEMQNPIVIIYCNNMDNPADNVILHFSNFFVKNVMIKHN